jgi:DNA-binding NtrC family response regulator
LAVDDEPAARYALTRAFQADFRVVEAATLAEARVRCATDRPDVILLDYSLPDGDGLTFLKELEAGPAVIMITAHGSERVAVDCMKAGAYDYLAKPYELDELRLIVARALERQRLLEEVRGLRAQLAAEGQFGAMAGESAPMRELFQLAERVAQTDLPLLLMGESGTGKDLLAQAIHAASGRADRRLVALNCAALPETLVESELFGYEKGAFTGAAAPRAGKFELAHEGTLFLDEIGDMAPATQSKILRAVEAGFVERLGGSRPIPIDVRLISATNKDLPAEVRAGRFREDLYFRLAGVTLRLPPLRERRDDIPRLVERFWADLQRKYGRPGPQLTREAMVALENAAWPGNVRELKSAVERLFVLARGGAVDPRDVAAAAGETSPAEARPAGWAAADYREAKRLFEIDYLSAKLREHGGNVTRTAAAIGLERQSLQEKIRKLGLQRNAGGDANGS